MSCINQADWFKVRQAPIDHLKELEMVKDIIIRNITLLEDSCCQNLVGTCNDPDSLRRRYFYPATKYLLSRYLPESEKARLTVLDELSRNHLFNKESNILSSEPSFRPDSTVVFPIYYQLYNDTIIEHKMIYANRPTHFYSGSKVKLIEKRQINKNWTYHIVAYKNEGR